MRHSLDSSSELTVEQAWVRCNYCGAKTSALTTPLNSRYESPRTLDGTDSQSGNSYYTVHDELVGCQNCGRNPYGAGNPGEVLLPAWKSAVRT